MLDFQRNVKKFEKRNIRVIAASADSWEKALQTVDIYKLTFKVGYGVNPREFSTLTGAFYSAKENYIHATGFIINPDGKIEDAVYSSRSVGRLVAKDCLEFIGYGNLPASPLEKGDFDNSPPLRKGG